MLEVLAQGARGSSVRYRAAARCVLWLSLVLPALPIPLVADTDEFVIRGARVIDGTGAALTSTSLHVREGRIVAIAPVIDASDAREIDGEGATVLPGLIDTHTHFVVAPGSGFRGDDAETIRKLNRHHLRAYLACGVTTVMDPGGYPPVVRDIQSWLAAGGPGPRFLTTGPYFRVPGGYGSEHHFGVDATLDAVDEKLKVIRSLEGVGVKFGLEDGVVNPEGELLDALRTGARSRGLPLYIHATSEMYQSRAIDLGARAIMHAPLQGIIFGQIWPDDLSEKFIQKHAASGVYQLTTLGLIDNWIGRFSRDWLDDPLIQLVVPAIEIESARDPESDRAFAIWALGWALPWTFEFVRPWLASIVWTKKNTDAAMAYSMRNLKRLHEAGVPIVAATDAPSPWDGSSTFFHGPGMLRELELLVEAGIPAMEAIIAATATPAAMLGLEKEIGTLQPGMRADLLIVNGDPLANIRALRDIRWTVRNGEIRTPSAWMTHPSAELAP